MHANEFFIVVEKQILTHDVPGSKFEKIHTLASYTDEMADRYKTYDEAKEKIEALSNYATEAGKMYGIEKIFVIA